MASTVLSGCQADWPTRLGVACPAADQPPYFVFHRNNTGHGVDVSVSYEDLERNTAFAASATRTPAPASRFTNTSHGSIYNLTADQVACHWERAATALGWNGTYAHEVHIALIGPVHAADQAALRSVIDAEFFELPSRIDNGSKEAATISQITVHAEDGRVHTVVFADRDCWRGECRQAHAYWDAQWQHLSNLDQAWMPAFDPSPPP